MKKALVPYTRVTPANEYAQLWGLWFLIWLKHWHNEQRRAICQRHLTALEALGA